MPGSDLGDFRLNQHFADTGANAVGAQNRGSPISTKRMFPGSCIRGVSLVPQHPVEQLDILG